MKAEDTVKWLEHVKRKSREGLDQIVEEVIGDKSVQAREKALKLLKEKPTDEDVRWNRKLSYIMLVLSGAFLVGTLISYLKSGWVFPTTILTGGVLAFLIAFVHYWGMAKEQERLSKLSDREYLRERMKQEEYEGVVEDSEQEWEHEADPIDPTSPLYRSTHIDEP